MAEEQVGTVYHVLRLESHDQDGEHWIVCLTNVEARSDKIARDAYVKAEYEKGRTVTDRLVAVPVRSWRPQRPVVTPSPQITYQDA